MLSRQVLLTSALTLACALGIGFYMQAPGTDGTAAINVPADPELPGEPGLPRLKIENITLTSAPAGTADDPVNPAVSPACRMTASAEPALDAMVSLTVAAPCHAREQITVHHSGMAFTVTLNQSGRFAAMVPALAQTAVFIAETDDGNGAVAVAHVDGLQDVQRVVLQWNGRSGFEIHAREFGAPYGSAGHVWNGAPQAAGAGQLVRLGDSSILTPRLAEVYSLPSSGADQPGSVAITAEVEVTAGNCGRDISAQALQLRNGQLTSRDLVMSVPGCDASGSFLVLNNLVEDLKIASN